MALRVLWYTSVLTFAVFRTSAELVNVTIDDLSDVFTYTPSNAWTTGDASCTTCAPGLQASELMSNTWHQTNLTVNTGTDPPSEVKAAVSFAGTSLYVFGYNELLCMLEGLPAGTHTLEIINGDPKQLLTGDDGNRNNSFLILDYLVYTRDTDIDSPLPASQTGQSSTTGSTTPSSAATANHTSSASSLAASTEHVLPILIVGCLAWIADANF
ncbi:uncharacterized protein BXZ73DRAFT_102644 [Epithele typhae]|uniref:uncharacterized protein n=1 Tax=Epithele typhae TaxID=378194 RepID=UPI002008CD34|nr:uncharacterized protein BXZ73DRAFT_102644 [Epithele typhae]KAH9927514.1 hypothetical protein BXZ73DRAFT_102644 [Epithele typhae]